MHTLIEAPFSNSKATWPLLSQGPKVIPSQGPKVGRIQKGYINPTVSGFFFQNSILHQILSALGINM